MNVLKTLSRLADLLAAVYSVEMIVKQRHYHLERKSQKDKVMNIKNAVMFFVLASASLFATTRAQDIPEVVFIATTEKATGPAMTKEGYVNLVLDNQDDSKRALGIFRVKDGADTKAAKNLVVRAFSGEDTFEDEKVLTDGFYGGAVFVEPNTQKEVGVTLVPGTYVVYADGITDEGIEITPDYITTLEVTPSNAEGVTPPIPDYTIKMVDHAFAFPADIKAGKHLFRVENLGQQEHMMFISKYLPGKGHEDGLAILEDPTADPNTVFEEETMGVHGISSDGFNDVVLELEPGTYGAICFVTDPETGAPHAMLGMFQSFTVSE
jgi:hypothetical protein